MSFTGFPERMLGFLKENKERNDREWYFAHKTEFKELVQKPFFELTEELSPVFEAIDPHIITDPRRCLCHVYRDARRIKPGTSFYRDNMWTFYRRDSRISPNTPGYYFEVTQTYIGFGMYWEPENRSLMKAYRQFILDNTEEFRASLSKIKLFKSSFDVFKKKYSDISPLGLEPFFAAKNLHFCHIDDNLSDLYSPEIVDYAKSAYLQTADLYNILSELQVSGSDSVSPDIPSSNIDAYEW